MGNEIIPDVDFGALEGDEDAPAFNESPTAISTNARKVVEGKAWLDAAAAEAGEVDPDAHQAGDGVTGAGEDDPVDSPNRRTTPRPAKKAAAKAPAAKAPAKKAPAKKAPAKKAPAKK